MAGTWRSLSNQPSFAVDTMLLLTDASVMCHEYGSPNWHRLVPNSQFDYSHGSWHPTAPMPANAPKSQGGPTNAPLYFASAVLRDGRLFVAGGEYNGGNDVELLAAEIYDPVADHWTSIPTPPGWSNIGDSPSAVLTDGRVLIGDITSGQTAIYDPVSGHWTSGPAKPGSSSEEGWTLLPDGTVLAVNVDDAPNASKFVPAQNHWVSASRTPAGHGLIASSSDEIGPAVLMTDGRVFAIGATGHTCLYTPPATPTDPGTWIAGPDFPADAAHHLLCAPDAPACLLPNGKVLCAVGPLSTSGPNSGFAGQPTRFFEFDGAHLNEVSHPSSAAAAMTYDCRLLVLPTGEVLLSTADSQLDLYTPDGAPNPAWAPRIHSAPAAIASSGTYSLSGVQFTGLSQANAYGDDAQMATNFPLAVVRHTASGATSCVRTHDHSTMAVATGNRTVSTHITVPVIASGPATIEVIANGLRSQPVDINVLTTAYQHVSLRAADGHVHELYDALGSGHWAQNDLTANTGAPAASAGSPLACGVDPGYQHVMFVGGDGHVHELYDALGAGHWAHNDLTAKANGPVAGAGTALAFWIDAAHQHVAFTGADGHVHELYAALGAGQWGHNDLTALAGAPVAVTDTALAAWTDVAFQHVVFVSGDGHVHELYNALGTVSWAHNDLTGLTAAPVGATATALASWIDSGYQHVVFTGGDGHVHELYNGLGTVSWAHNDLTAHAGAPTAGAGTALAAWLDASYQHVAFTGGDGHVHELYDALGAGHWSHNDLTAKTGAPVAAGGRSVGCWLDVALRAV